MCGTASSQKCHAYLLQFVMLSIYHLFSRISIHLQRYFIKIRAAVHYFVQQTPFAGCPAAVKSVFDVRASKRYDTSMDRNGKRMIQNDQVQEDPRKTKTQFSCGKSFSRPAAYRIHRVLTSPWFSPSCPKAEVSLFCDGS